MLRNASYSDAYTARNNPWFLMYIKHWYQTH